MLMENADLSNAFEMLFYVKKRNGARLESNTPQACEILFSV